MAKMVGAHCGKNGWSSLWQKWVELTVAKMGGAHCGKNKGGIGVSPMHPKFFFEIKFQTLYF